MFITGHTHQPYNCLIDNRPVTSASSFGRLISNINLTLGRSGDVSKVTAENLPMYADGRTPAADVDKLVKYYEDRSKAAARAAGRQDHPADHARLRRLAREPGRQPDRRRAARGHRRGRPRRRGGRADEPGRRARRLHGRRDRHLRGGVHRPAVQQPGRHPDVHGRPAAGRAEGSVVRHELGADGAAAVEHDQLHVRPVRGHLDPRPAVRGRGEPGERRDDRRRGAEPGRLLPDHDEQLPRRRRG